MSIYNPLTLILLPPTHTDPKPLPTALAIDPLADLLWCGSSTGVVSTYCSPSHLSPNVRFPAHGADASGSLLSGGSGSVRGIRVTDREVWTLTEGGVGGRRRGGAAKWNVSDPARGLRAMCGNPTNSHEVVAGGMNGLVIANTARGEVLKRIDTSPIVHLSDASRSVFSASQSGQVSILDPRIGFKTSSTVSPVQAHTGGLNGVDARGHIVCTWGWTHMSGHPLPDPLVRLYDVRTLRALPPISFPAGPAFAVLHPSDPSKLVISSQQGMLQAIDMASGSSGAFVQLDVSSYITSMTMSSTGDYLAFGDADGQIHLWTALDTEERNEDGTLALTPFGTGVRTEWPDPPDPLPNVEWTDATPLNAIGMPHYNEPLLSYFSTTAYAPASSPFFNPPPLIPEPVLASMKMVDFVGYATMPHELRGKRYVVSARPGAGRRATDRGFVDRKQSGPKFLSERDRWKNLSVDDDVGEIPKWYRQVSIKYSKFGVEDFDFSFYNQTTHSGLETDIFNSYTNALLQALHYSNPIRSVAKAHICVDCKREHCLLCEAGFLFRMLEDARGINCQASNFSRAFSATPQATALGLIDLGDKRTSYAALTQNLNRWLLSTFSVEHLDLRPSIDDVLGIPTTTTITCQQCGFTSSRDSTIHVIDLAYPRKPEGTFTDILHSSIVRESSTRASCSNCRQFALLQTRRSLASSLPPVISLNLMVTSPDILELWQGDFLPPSVSVASLPDGDITVSLDEDGDVYNVTSLVAHIQTEGSSHLVAFAKISGEWFVFNDFLVQPVPPEEVFTFEPWKIPAVIFLQRRDLKVDVDALPTQLGPNALLEDVSIAFNRRRNLIKHKILDPEEMPPRGSLVSIDAEFVALQQEEMEFRSDGTKNILKPSHMSLARVSVLRGEGRDEGIPFIDDYIHTSETVVDYLTEFSGIKSGDLDPNNSPHTLVPLKVAYKKLRLLVDLGCIFIGHGLSKDFRTINIFVPPTQVMDTVNLYVLPGQRRKLSLRFLTWFLLKKDIQTSMHDSIEDAKYALLLYRLYQRFVEENRFDDVVEDIFYEGQKLGFKPPLQVEASPQPPQPQPPPVHSTPQRTPRQHPSSHNLRGRRGRR
ncbi:ubiquitin carboxyl-terminal hydrolase-domain-containing protein [Kockovaella imperatae]|uniref:PAN2-PAN3 deadenylation complex catalytic subunit PAN2 n=1 Tax=Kockovaella imperatae TaxID=4999 RepID=A0A1Y1U6W2_9TREE|nr:ubiquitin carboxyl-terminal hydrolase-domain-containing protein [Kockovaella imperatae]ORX33274.1 ubiquitin carboxyl-terminal hydrolase-domain-containing protein [Kockovaella imperatae]